MKQSAVLLGLAAGLAAASHHDHAHAHNHVRRGDDGVVTSWDIKTEWTYVTVTGPPAAGHTPDAPAGNASPVHAAAAPSSSAADDEVSAAAVTSAAASGGASDPVAIQNSKNAAQASINAAQQSANNAHQSSMLALQAGSAKATTSAQAQATSAVAVSSAAAPSVAKTSSAAASPSATGGSTGGSTSGGWTAIGTYYGGSGGTGSCGNALSDDGHTVAIAENIMSASKAGGSYPKLCGAKITIVSGGKTWDATVQDSCGACSTDPNGHIDIVQGYAHVIDPNIDVAGHADLTWSFNDASMAALWKQYS